MQTYGSTPDEFSILAEDHWSSPVSAIPGGLVQEVIRLDKPVARGYGSLVVHCYVPIWSLNIWSLWQVSAAALAHSFRACSSTYADKSVTVVKNVCSIVAVNLPTKQGDEAYPAPWAREGSTAARAGHPGIGRIPCKVKR